MFEMPLTWSIHHRSETVSTNLDARSGVPGDVFTADFQTAGRGRLNHRWLAPPGANLSMSVVLGVKGIAPEQVATLPLVVGYAVALGLRSLLRGLSPVQRGLSPSSIVDSETLTNCLTAATSVANDLPQIAIKWPNDVFLNGKKVGGILCEREGDKIIAGIGINVKPREFPPEIANTATFLGVCPQICGVCPQPENGVCPQPSGVCPQWEGAVERVRDTVLDELDRCVTKWRREGFQSILSGLKELDFLWGQTLEIARFDGDSAPVRGKCGGIQEDGSLLVGGERIYAGEAHVLAVESSR